MEAEDNQKTLNFIYAINYLAKHNSGFDIVLRPHPVENKEAWKVFLEDLPNVYVENNNCITPWINNSFALMHNSCTSAIEASISGKPIITYTPFNQKFAREIPNEIGYKVETLEKLSETVNNLFNEAKLKKKIRINQIKYPI